MSEDGMEEIKISGFDHFMKVIASEASTHTLFRGRHEDWPLLPKLARLTPRLGSPGRRSQ